MKNTITIKVEGMHCAGCENRINNAVKAIRGVKSVKASCTDKNVVIVANDKVDMGQIKDTIESIGFTPVY